MESVQLGKREYWAWITLPLFIKKRVSGILGLALMDGLYLTAFTKRTLLIPPVLFALSFCVGAWHLSFQGEEIYSASLLVMALWIFLGSWSAAFGFWLWLGYAIGDLLLHPHSSSQNQPLYFLARTIPIALLFVLLVTIPIACKVLSIKSLSKTPDNSVRRRLLYAGFYSLSFGVLIYCWTQAVPILLRPVYTWQYAQPTIAVVQPLQTYGVHLAVFATCLALLRMAIERRVASHGKLDALHRELSQISQSGNSKRKTPALIRWLKTLSAILIYTFLFSGFLETWTDRIAFAISLLGVFILRARLTGNNSWTRAVTKIPALIRVVMAQMIISLLAYGIISYFWKRGGNAFNPVYYSVIISFLIQIILFPKMSKNEAQG